ncbi:MAG TPA: prephenate dehydrogenase/arogenate dehydrogenase family protein [Lachnospiraceae bacterium]|nr:prephenate dehydrogenase/arogenate dehydrogenase family protein [Lachnospiraceae bacterium]
MTYGLIGLGLIGGSLAINLRKNEPDCFLMAVSHSPETCRKAYEKGIIDFICDGPEDPRFSQCNMIFLCAPAEENISVLPKLRQVLSATCLLTDVGSVKSPIHEAVSNLGLSAQFIGGHPMAGSEKSGLENATDHLFENAYYVLTPTREVSPDRVEQLRTFILSLKAIPLILDPAEHDFITAAISHLPHVVAASLVNTVHELDSEQEHMKTIAAGGFRDITRIASCSPPMWESICVENSSNISRVMDTFLDQMIAARDHMCSGDGGYIYHMFERSRDYRNSFSFASNGPVKSTFRIYCDVIDESGAIATVATILAVHSISLKNISIVHNRAYEQGALSIEFYDRKAMKKAVSLLRHHRYTIWENE